MVWLRHNPVQRRIDAPPFGEQLGEYFRALIRQAVEPLVALGLFAPLAKE